MPVEKNFPEYMKEGEKWIAPIVAELNEAPNSGVEGSPVIIEDYQGFSDKFSVRVVWDFWEGVPLEHRVPLVLEAYKRSGRADDLPKITHARGLTRSEKLAEDIVERYNQANDLGAGLNLPPGYRPLFAVKRQP